MKMLISKSLLLCLIGLIKANLSWIKEDLEFWPGVCQTGTKQSPIDIPINFPSYDTSSVLRIVSTHYPATNNYTILVKNKKSFGSESPQNDTYIMVEKNKIKYRMDFVNFHIHYLSEHTFGGKNDDIEMHIVHQKNQAYLTDNKITDPDSIHSLLVIGVRIRGVGTKPHPFFSKLSISSTNTTLQTSLNEFMPVGKPFFHYEGSLTTPNCDEIVNWVVNKDILEISTAQYENMKSWIAANAYEPKINRATKPLNGRKIYYQYYPEDAAVPSKASYLSITYVIFMFIAYLLA